VLLEMMSNIDVRFRDIFPPDKTAAAFKGRAWPSPGFGALERATILSGTAFPLEPERHPRCLGLVACKFRPHAARIVRTQTGRKFVLRQAERQFGRGIQTFFETTSKMADHDTESTTEATELSAPRAKESQDADANAP
jgi:hypothetical protein